MAPVLDRIARFDDRSKQYPVTRALPRRNASDLVTTVWHSGPILDQGEEGACVGFGWSAELAADPVPVSGIDNMYAQNLYSSAVSIDEAEGIFMGGEGASVISGAKACADRGLIREYRWAFGADDVLHSLVHLGPVVLGLNWYSGMYETNSEGRVSVTGDIVGGHCITATAISVDQGLVIWQNSWGESYGVDGFGAISFEDLDRLLHEDGEACVPMLRAYGPEPAIAEEPAGGTAPTPGLDDRPGCVWPFRSLRRR